MVVADHPQVGAARGQCAMLLELILACPTMPDGFPLDRAAAQRLALTRFPTAVPLLWQIAAEHNRRGRFAECAELLERIMKLGQTQSYERLVSFDPAIMGDDARLNLAVCYVRQGRVSQARQLFKKLLDSPTRGREAAANLEALAKLKRR
jgi:hypothetical protein